MEYKSIYAMSVLDNAKINEEDANVTFNKRLYLGYFLDLETARETLADRIRDFTEPVNYQIVVIEEIELNCIVPDVIGRELYIIDMINHEIYNQWDLKKFPRELVMSGINTYMMRER